MFFVGDLNFSQQATRILNIRKAGNFTIDIRLHIPDKVFMLWEFVGFKSWLAIHDIKRRITPFKEFSSKVDDVLSLEYIYKYTCKKH